ncbi:MAG: ABC transporter permease, partial [Eubacteriales bacterium]|nr:ABC transporter permease [Eubacteriales bacterium]
MDEHKQESIDLTEFSDADLEQHFRVISPGRMVAKRFFKSKLSIVGLAMIIFVFLFSFVGPMVVKATWGYGETQVFKVERETDMVTVAKF